MKIVLASDNHNDRLALMRIAYSNNDADYYWHLGDSQEMDASLIAPFMSVRGNCDHDRSLPLERVVEIAGHRLLLMHGHTCFTGTLASLASRAKKQDCDILLFGHTHVFTDEEILGVRCINPGSCTAPRDGDKPSYALLYLENDGLVRVERKFLTV